jgi:hypothetical protein
LDLEAHGCSNIAGVAAADLTGLEPAATASGTRGDPSCHRARSKEAPPRDQRRTPPNDPLWQATICPLGEDSIEYWTPRTDR